MFVVCMELLCQLEVLFYTHYVGVVEEVEKEAEQTDQDQGYPIEAQEEPEHGHCNVVSLQGWAHVSTDNLGCFVKWF